MSTSNKQNDNPPKTEDVEAILARLAAQLSGAHLDSLSSAIVTAEDDRKAGEHDATTITEIASQLEAIELEGEATIPPGIPEPELGDLGQEAEASQYIQTLTGARKYWTVKMLRAGTPIRQIKQLHEATDAVRMKKRLRRKGGSAGDDAVEEKPRLQYGTPEYYALSRRERLSKLAGKYRNEEVEEMRPMERSRGSEAEDDSMDVEG